MTRTVLALAALAAIDCRGPTEVPTPSGPSLSGTVAYTAGGTIQVAGAQGYYLWASADQPPWVRILGFANAQAGTDSLHPGLAGFEITIAGSRLSTFPIEISLPLGVTGGTSLGVWVLNDGANGTGYWAADSGSVTVRPLGGGYVHVDLSVRCSALRFQGSLEVPSGGP